MICAPRTAGGCLRIRRGIGTTRQEPARATTSREPIERSIYLVRGEKIVFDFDLADPYEVETRVLIQSVKRNAMRFPADFMFQISCRELANLRSQIVMSSSGAWGGRRRPRADSCA